MPSPSTASCWSCSASAADHLTILERFDKVRIVPRDQGDDDEGRAGGRRVRRRRTAFVVLGAEDDERFEDGDAWAVQAVADPLRLRILRRLAEPMSARDLAAELGRPVTSLYHHLDVLESRGLIRVVEVTKEGRVHIRRYQRTGGGLASAVRRVTVAAGDPDDGHRRIRLVARGRTDEARLAELERRVRSLLREYLDGETGVAYEVVVEVSPTSEEDR